MAKLKTLRTLRESAGKTQRSLAAEAGCSHGFIAHLEAGQAVRCKDETAIRIAEALGVPVTDLFVLDEPTPTVPDAHSTLPDELTAGGD